MNKNICTYIYAYKNSSITCFGKTLTLYLESKSMCLGDIHYYMTMTNIDKTIHKSEFNKLLNELGKYQELILIKSIYSPKNKLELIENRCIELKYKIITISKHGELLGVKN